MKPRLRPGLPVLCLALLATRVLAQEPGNVRNWAVTCTNSGGDDAMQCEMSQSIVLTDTGARIITATIRRANGAHPALMLTLPHGIYLPAGVGMEIDDRPRTELVVQTCDASGCYAGNEVDPGELDAMRKGRELRFFIQDLQRREIRMTLNLGGFDGAYASMR